MGKRSDFKRKERDFYPTPYEAMPPLLPHIINIKRFAEPCAGNGALVEHLEHHRKKCYWQSDIEPQGEGIQKADALTLTTPLEWSGCIITNPPWPLAGQKGEPVISLIKHFVRFAPTWLLLSSDFMHNKYFTESGISSLCHKIISVGRLKWIPGSNTVGKDNCAWYLFENFDGQTIFHGRR